MEKKQKPKNDKDSEQESDNGRQRLHGSTQTNQPGDTPRSKKSKISSLSNIKATKATTKTTNDGKTTTKIVFDPYISLSDVQEGLQKGELFKDSLRINLKNYKEAYISGPDGQMDICIKGVQNRNRALNGDIVAVQINPKQDWRILYDVIEDYQENPKKSKRSKTNEDPVHENNSSVKFKNIESLTIDEVMKHPMWKEFIQKTGKVVYVLERKHSCNAVGNIKLLKNKDPNIALFSPKDSRLPKFLIPMSDCPRGFYQRPQDFEKFLYLGHIEEWNGYIFAKGRLMKKLGNVKEIDGQTTGLLYEYDIDFKKFSQAIISCLPLSENWSIPETELENRLDCRMGCIFTIDPATALDMDDAVSCEFLANGNYLIGVHIADVAYFVQEKTPLDECAKKRATSVYLVQRVIPMLPKVLCDDLCSLNPGQDRLTFSVFWEMTPDCEIRNHYFKRAVINSCIKLSYEHAQDMIEHPDRQWTSDEHPPLYGSFTISDVISRVLILHQLAVKLRRQRFTDGALLLDQEKLLFNLSKETGYPLGFSMYTQKDSNRLIEEFMLLANMTVAKQIYNAFPNLALLRRHKPPQVKVIKDVVRNCSSMAIHLDISSSSALQASLNCLKDEISAAKYLVVTKLCLKSMKRAEYFCTGVLKNIEHFHHYALNIPFYTHFTSPIRRYPDIIVHRMLAASLGLGPSPSTQPSEIEEQAIHCNDKKFNAKCVNNMSAELFLAAFILESGPISAKAMVIKVMDHSFDCLVLKFGITRKIYCDKFIDKKFRNVNGIHTLTFKWDNGQRNNELHTITMFSQVDVLLTSNDEFQILADLKNPSST